MKRYSWVTIVVGVSIILSLLLAACQTAPSAGPPAKAEEKPKVEAPAPAKAAEAPKVEAPAKPAEAPKVEAPAKPAEAPKVEAKPAAKDPYRVGVVSTLTGPYAAVFGETRDGAAVEVDRINAAGGIDGHPLELIIEDDGMDATRAATSLTKLIKQDNVLAVIGPSYAAMEGSVRPVAEREQVPQILVGAAIPDSRTKNYKWSFNLNQNEFIGAEAVLDIIKEKGYKKLVGIRDVSPQLETFLIKVKADGAPNGIEVIAMDDVVSTKDIDATPQVMKMKEIVGREKPQAVLIVGGAVSMPIVKGMKQLGVDLPVVGTPYMAVQQVVDTLGELANGIVLPGAKYLDAEKLTSSDPQKPLLLDFQKRFVAKSGKQIQGPAAYGGGDAIRLIEKALKAVGPDRAKIRDNIESTTSFVTLLGTYSYKPNDHEGLSKQSLGVYEIRDKKFNFVRDIK